MLVGAGDKVQADETVINSAVNNQQVIKICRGLGYPSVGYDTPMIASVDEQQRQVGSE
jgi:hypothetical protein